MNKMLLAVASTIEAVTGLALLLMPALVLMLLLGKHVSSPLLLARVAGLGLLSLGFACWPRVEATLPAVRAMLIYNLLAATYLAYLQFSDHYPGKLLLPALALHAILSVLFLLAWFKYRQPAKGT